MLLKWLVLINKMSELFHNAHRVIIAFHIYQDQIGQDCLSLCRRVWLKRYTEEHRHKKARFRISYDKDYLDFFMRENVLLSCPIPIFKMRDEHADQDTKIMVGWSHSNAWNGISSQAYRMSHRDLKLWVTAKRIRSTG